MFTHTQGRSGGGGPGHQARGRCHSVDTRFHQHHSRRVFWFGSFLARNRDVSFDPELLYVAAMFHDLGPNEQFRGSGRRFEVDSAEARRFLQGHAVPEDSVRSVWTAIGPRRPRVHGTRSRTRHRGGRVRRSRLNRFRLSGPPGT